MKPTNRAFKLISIAIAASLVATLGTAPQAYAKLEPDIADYTPTFAVEWNGSAVPTAAIEIHSIHSTKPMGHTPSHELVTASSDDGTWFQALVAINDVSASTEFRFINAVPPGHKAEIQSDGSIAFYDPDGDLSGVVAAPWAFDASDNAVPTSFNLEGSTLIQVVEHRGYDYPVVADPLFLLPIVTVVFTSKVGQTAIACAIVPNCTTVVAATVKTEYFGVKSGINAIENSSKKSGGNQPTNKCNLRNKSGC